MGGVGMIGGRLRLALLGFLVALAGVLLLELAARTLWRGEAGEAGEADPTLADWMIFSPQLGWEPRPNFAGDLFGGPAQFDERGHRVTPASRPTAGGPRIVVLGDSVAHGYGVVDQDTFANRLAERLRGAEVINLAVSAYTSFQGLTVLESKALPLHPHVIIAAFNFNDRRYVLHPALQDGARRFRHFYLGRLAEPLHRLGLARGLRRAAPALFGGGWPENVDLRTLTVRVPPDAFRANLERMADLAQQHRARLVWIQFGDNPLIASRLRRGLEALRAGRFVQAAKWLEPAFQDDSPLIDLARLLLSEAYASLGQAEEAEDAARTPPLPWVTGGNVLYPDTDYAAVAREVADRRGIPLFDARRLLDAEPDVYQDIAHFDARGHALVAEGLARFLRERGIVGGPSAARGGKEERP